MIGRDALRNMVNAGGSGINLNACLPFMGVNLNGITSGVNHVAAGKRKGAGVSLAPLA
jgi:hypothetical protein